MWFVKIGFYASSAIQTTNNITKSFEFSYFKIKSDFRFMSQKKEFVMA